MRVGPGGDPWRSRKRSLHSVRLSTLLQGEGTVARFRLFAQDLAGFNARDMVRFLVGAWLILLDGYGNISADFLECIAEIERGCSMGKLDQLLEQEKQLKARIQREKAKLGVQERKERTGRLIAWGVVIEQKLLDPEISLTPEQWVEECRQFLNGRTLERALTGPLTEFNNTINEEKRSIYET